METFDGQVVMVTGGATGLGAAIVERFALLGADCGLLLQQEPGRCRGAGREAA